MKKITLSTQLRLLKTLIIVCVCSLFCVFTSCNDNDLQKQIDDLQEQIDANTQAINDLKDLVGDGLYIKEIKVNGSELTVVMSDGSVHTLFDFAAGVWTIGEDGYWYCNGEKTDHKAIGEDGKNGENGKSPRVNSQGFWEVWVWDETIQPEGGEWVSTNIQAGGSNNVIQDPTTGDLIFTIVTESGETQEVRISTKGHVQLTSLEAVGSIYTYGMPTVVPTMISGFNPDGCGEFFQYYSIKTTLQYRLNPSNADVSNVEWQFINKHAQEAGLTKAIDWENVDELVKVVSAEVADGCVTLQVQFAYEHSFQLNPYVIVGANSHEANCDMIALQAVYPAAAGEDTIKVVSDNMIVPDYLHQFVKSHVTLYNEGRPSYDQMYVELTLDEPEDINDLEGYSGVDPNLKANIVEFNSTGSVDMNDYTEAGYNNMVGTGVFVPLSMRIDESEYSFRFSMIDSFMDKYGTVNMNEWFEVDQNGILSVKEDKRGDVSGKYGVVKVELMSDPDMHGGEIYPASVAYIAVKPVVPEITTSTEAIEIEYDDFYASETYDLYFPYDKFQEEVLDELDMTYDEWLEIYDTDSFNTYGNITRYNSARDCFDPVYGNGHKVTVTADPDGNFYTLTVGDKNKYLATNTEITYQLIIEANSGENAPINFKFEHTFTIVE